MIDTLPVPDITSFDFAELEKRVITICGIDPASLEGDRTAVLAALYGCGRQQIVIIDDFDMSIDNDLLPRDITEFDIERGTRTITGRIDGLIDDEFFKALSRLQEAKPEARPDIKPDNRKQRRIDAAKERQKPRGQRKRMIMDLETYDPNRAQDWKHNGPRGTRTDIAWR